MGKERFSSEEHMQDIVDFQDFAWSISKDFYNLLVGRYLPSNPNSIEIDTVHKGISQFLSELKTSNQYARLLGQVKDYLNFCKNQWDNNYQKTSKLISELTGLDLNKEFYVYITHPSLKNGMSSRDLIFWGHKEEWPNYTTIYLWHEILHSYFEDHNDINHAIIELVTDNELRSKLNNVKYPPFEGHRELFPSMEKIMPKWKNYLSSNKKDIMKFRETVAYGFS